MIVLDTNVISALMRTEPEKPVVKWLDSQPAASVWITAITVMEIRFGLQTMPTGRRQEALIRAFELMLKSMIEGRIASFDAEAGLHAAQLMAQRKRKGRPRRGARHDDRWNCACEPRDASDAKHTTFRRFASDCY